MTPIRKKFLPYALGALLWSTTPALYAAQLGKIQVLSKPGEPFLAEIQIENIQPGEQDTLKARLASKEAFAAARLSMDPQLSKVSVSVQRKEGSGETVVRLSAATALEPGFIDTLVDLSWAGGQVAREYTLTLPVAAPTGPSIPEIAHRAKPCVA
ncbi:MAG: hypothetical protein HC848_08755 [Limnobacter sp.]|nr:hypothetical protein [Limnobacter sp.]